MVFRVPQGKYEIRNAWFTDRVHAGDVIYSPGAKTTIPNRQDYQLFLLYDGEAIMERNGKIFSLTPGVVTLLKPGMTEHWTFSKESETRHGWICISPGINAPNLWKRLNNAPFELNCLPEIQSVLNIIKQLPVETTADVDKILSRYACAAFEHYLFYGNRFLKNKQTDLPTAVRKADAYIHTHYADPITLDDLTRAAGVCPKHLTQLFKASHHTTPIRYLWEHRIKRAANLLRHTDLSIQNISEQTGFQNPYHFSRLFKQTFGCSPREYRTK